MHTGTIYAVCGIKVSWQREIRIQKPWILSYSFWKLLSKFYLDYEVKESEDKIEIFLIL